MYMLYFKQLHIVKEQLTKNCCCQTWRGKQIAMSESKEALKEYIAQQPEGERDRYYIEKLPY